MFQQWFIWKLLTITVKTNGEETVIFKQKFVLVISKRWAFNFFHVFSWFFKYFFKVLIIVVGTNHCLSCGCFQWWGEEEEGEESICWSFITRGRMQSLKKAKRLGVKIKWTVLRLWKCVKFTSLSCTLKKKEREGESSECNWLCEENESVWVLKINSW